MQDCQTILGARFETGIRKRGAAPHWPSIKDVIKEARQRCQELQAGRESSWKDLTVAEIEEAGQQELMSWICVAGAMHELGQKGEVVEYLETAGVFNSGKCLAVWRP